MSSRNIEPEHTMQLALTAAESDTLMQLLHRAIDALWDSHGDVFGSALWTDELAREQPSEDLEDIY